MRYLVLLFLCGCGLENIRDERYATVEASKAIFLKIVDKAKIDSSHIDAGGKVINPKYEYTWFGGIGPYSHGSIQAIGVELEASAVASGLGEGAPDQDMRNKIYDILTQRNFNEQERKDRIIGLLFPTTMPTTEP